MAYAPLFHEIYTDLFQNLITIINRIHSGERMTKQEIINNFPQVDWSNVKDYHNILNTIFLFDENDQAHLFIDAPLSSAPSCNEISFLMQLLYSTEAQHLLPPCLIAKLRHLLSNQSPPKNNFTIIRDTGDDYQQIAANLAAIWQALTEQKQINYINKDTQGHTHQGSCAPCRLEYDATGNKYRLIAWLDDEGRAIKMNIDRMSELTISSKAISEDCQNKFNRFLASKKKNFTLQITPKYNAVERTFKLFASYDKKSFYNESLGIYTLNIEYYAFDEQELIRDILSLGSAARITSPHDLREKIKNILLQSWNNVIRPSYD